MAFDPHWDFANVREPDDRLEKGAINSAYLPVVANLQGVLESPYEPHPMGWDRKKKPVTRRHAVTGQVFVERDRDPLIQSFIDFGLGKGESPIKALNPFGKNPLDNVSPFDLTLVESAAAAISNKNFGKHVSGGLAQLFQGFVKGFTTLSIGDAPEGTIENLTYSVGNLLGFLGIIPGLGTIGKIVTTGTVLGAKGAIHLSRFAKGFGSTVAKEAAEKLSVKAKEKILAATAPRTGHAIPGVIEFSSVPRYLGDIVTRGVTKGLQSQYALNLLKKSPDLARLAAAEGSVLRHIGNQTVSMGVAFSVGSWQEGADAMLQSFALGAVFGGFDRVLVNVGPLKRLVTEGRFVGQPKIKDLSLLWKGETPEVRKEASRIAARAFAGGMFNMVSGQALGQPSELWWYDFLLGAYFGGKEISAHQQRALKIIGHYQQIPNGHLKLMEHPQMVDNQAPGLVKVSDVHEGALWHDETVKELKNWVKQTQIALDNAALQAILKHNETDLEEWNDQVAKGELTEGFRANLINSGLITGQELDAHMAKHGKITEEDISQWSQDKGNQFRAELAQHALDEKLQELDKEAEETRKERRTYGLIAKIESIRQAESGRQEALADEILARENERERAIEKMEKAETEDEKAFHKEEIDTLESELNILQAEINNQIKAEAPKTDEDAEQIDLVDAVKEATKALEKAREARRKTQTALQKETRDRVIRLSTMSDEEFNLMLSSLNDAELAALELQLAAEIGSQVSPSKRQRVGELREAIARVVMGKIYGKQGEGEVHPLRRHLEHRDELAARVQVLEDLSQTLANRGQKTSFYRGVIRLTQLISYKSLRDHGIAIEVLDNNVTATQFQKILRDKTPQDVSNTLSLLELNTLGPEQHIRALEQTLRIADKDRRQAHHDFEHKSMVLENLKAQDEPNESKIKTVENDLHRHASEISRVDEIYTSAKDNLEAALKKLEKDPEKTQAYRRYEEKVMILRGREKQYEKTELVREATKDNAERLVTKLEHDFEAWNVLLKTIPDSKFAEIRKNLWKTVNKFIGQTRKQLNDRIARAKEGVEIEIAGEKRVVKWRSLVDIQRDLAKQEKELDAFVKADDEVKTDMMYSEEDQTPRTYEQHEIALRYRIDQTKKEFQEIIVLEAQHGIENSRRRLDRLHRMKRAVNENTEARKKRKERTPEEKDSDAEMRKMSQLTDGTMHADADIKSPMQMIARESLKAIHDAIARTGIGERAESEQEFMERVLQKAEQQKHEETEGAEVSLDELQSVLESYINHMENSNMSTRNIIRLMSQLMSATPEVSALRETIMEQMKEFDENLDEAAVKREFNARLAQAMVEVQRTVIDGLIKTREKFTTYVVEKMKEAHENPNHELAEEKDFVKFLPSPKEKQVMFNEFVEQVISDIQRVVGFRINLSEVMLGKLRKLFINEGFKQKYHTSVAVLPWKVKELSKRPKENEEKHRADEPTPEDMEAQLQAMYEADEAPRETVIVKGPDIDYDAAAKADAEAAAKAAAKPPEKAPEEAPKPAEKAPEKSPEKTEHEAELKKQKEEIETKEQEINVLKSALKRAKNALKDFKESFKLSQKQKEERNREANKSENAKIKEIKSSKSKLRKARLWELRDFVVNEKEEARSPKDPNAKYSNQSKLAEKIALFINRKDYEILSRFIKALKKKDMATAGEIYADEGFPLFPDIYELIGKTNAHFAHAEQALFEEAIKLYKKRSKFRPSDKTIVLRAKSELEYENELSVEAKRNRIEEDYWTLHTRHVDSPIIGGELEGVHRDYIRKLEEIRDRVKTEKSKDALIDAIKEIIHLKQKVKVMSEFSEEYQEEGGTPWEKWAGQIKDGIDPTSEEIVEFISQEILEVNQESDIVREKRMSRLMHLNANVRNVEEKDTVKKLEDDDGYKRRIDNIEKIENDIKEKEAELEELKKPIEDPEPVPEPEPIPEPVPEPEPERVVEIGDADIIKRAVAVVQKAFKKAKEFVASLEKHEITDFAHGLEEASQLQKLAAYVEYINLLKGIQQQFARKDPITVDRKTAWKINAAKRKLLSIDGTIADNGGRINNVTPWDYLPKDRYGNKPRDRRDYSLKHIFEYIQEEIRIYSNKGKELQGRAVDYAESAIRAAIKIKEDYSAEEIQILKDFLEALNVRGRHDQIIGPYREIEAKAKPIIDRVLDILSPTGIKNKNLSYRAGFYSEEFDKLRFALSYADKLDVVLRRPAAPKPEVARAIEQQVAPREQPRPEAKPEPELDDDAYMYRDFDPDAQMDDPQPYPDDIPLPEPDWAGDPYGPEPVAPKATRPKPEPGPAKETISGEKEEASGDKEAESEREKNSREEIVDIDEFEDMVKIPADTYGQLSAESIIMNRIWRKFRGDNTLSPLGLAGVGVLRGRIDISLADENNPKVDLVPLMQDRSQKPDDIFDDLSHYSQLMIEKGYILMHGVSDKNYFLYIANPFKNAQQAENYIYSELDPLRDEIDKLDSKTKEKFNKVLDTIDRAREHRAKEGLDDTEDVIIDRHLYGFAARMAYHAEMNNMSFADLFRRHANGGPDAGDFLSNALKSNKRIQITFQRRMTIETMDLNKIPTLEDSVRDTNALKILLLDDHKWPNTPESDGVILLRDDVFDAIVTQFGFDEKKNGKIGALKPFINHVTDPNGLGALLGKASFQRAGAEHQRFMRENGIQMIGYHSALKQIGHRKKYTLNIKDGKVLGINEGGTMETYDVPLESISLNDAIYDRVSDVGKEVSMPVQYYHYLLREDREALDALEDAFFGEGSSWGGHSEANGKVEAIIRAYKEKADSWTDLESELLKDLNIDDIGMQAKLSVIYGLRDTKSQLYTKVVLDIMEWSRHDDRALDDFEQPTRDPSVDLLNDMVMNRRTDRFWLDAGVSSGLHIADITSKPFNKYFNRVLESYVKDALFRPKWKHGMKTIMSYSDDVRGHINQGEVRLGRGAYSMKVKWGENGDQETTLKKAWEEFEAAGGWESAPDWMKRYMTVSTMRTPSSSLSGNRNLKFIGFLDVDGGVAQYHWMDMGYMGGADLDIDSAYLFQGMPDPFIDAMQKFQYQFHVKNAKGEMVYVPEKDPAIRKKFVVEEEAEWASDVYSLFSPMAFMRTSHSANIGKDMLAATQGYHKQVTPYYNYVLEKFGEKGRVFGEEGYEQIAVERLAYELSLHNYSEQQEILKNDVRYRNFEERVKKAEGKIDTRIKGELFENVMANFKDFNVEIDEGTRFYWTVEVRPGQLETINKYVRDMANYAADSANYSQLITQGKFQELITELIFDKSTFRLHVVDKDGKVQSFSKLVKGLDEDVQKYVRQGLSGKNLIKTWMKADPGFQAGRMGLTRVHKTDVTYKVRKYDQQTEKYEVEEVTQRAKFSIHNLANWLLRKTEHLPDELDPIAVRMAQRLVDLELPGVGLLREQGSMVWQESPVMDMYNEIAGGTAHDVTLPIAVPDAVGDYATSLFDLFDLHVGTGEQALGQYDNVHEVILQKYMEDTAFQDAFLKIIGRKRLNVLTGVTRARKGPDKFQLFEQMGDHADGKTGRERLHERFSLSMQEVWLSKYQEDPEYAQQLIEDQAVELYWQDMADLASATMAYTQHKKLEQLINPDIYRFLITTFEGATQAEAFRAFLSWQQHEVRSMDILAYRHEQQFQPDMAIRDATDLDPRLVESTQYFIIDYTTADGKKKSKKVESEVFKMWRDFISTRTTNKATVRKDIRDFQREAMSRGWGEAAPDVATDFSKGLLRYQQSYFIGTLTPQQKNIDEAMWHQRNKVRDAISAYNNKPDFKLEKAMNKEKHKLWELKKLWYSTSFNTDRLNALRGSPDIVKEFQQAVRVWWDATNYKLHSSDVRNLARGGTIDENGIVKLPDYSPAANPEADPVIRNIDRMFQEEVRTNVSENMSALAKATAKHEAASAEATGELMTESVNMARESRKLHWEADELVKKAVEAKEAELEVESRELFRQASVLRKEAIELARESKEMQRAFLDLSKTPQRAGDTVEFKSSKDANEYRLALLLRNLRNAETQLENLMKEIEEGKLFGEDLDSYSLKDINVIAETLGMSLQGLVPEAVVQRLKSVAAIIYNKHVLGIENAELDTASRPDMQDIENQITEVTPAGELVRGPVRKVSDTGIEVGARATYKSIRKALLDNGADASKAASKRLEEVVNVLDKNDPDRVRIESELAAEKERLAKNAHRIRTLQEELRNKIIAEDARQEKIRAWRKNMTELSKVRKEAHDTFMRTDPMQWTLFKKFREFVLLNPDMGKMFEERVLGTLSRLQNISGINVVPTFDRLTKENLITVLHAWNKMGIGNLKTQLPKMGKLHWWLLPDHLDESLRKHDLTWVKKTVVSRGLETKYREVLEPMSAMGDLTRIFRLMDISIDARINRMSIAWNKVSDSINGSITRGIAEALDSDGSIDPVGVFWRGAMTRRLIRYWDGVIKDKETELEKLKEVPEDDIYFDPKRIKASEENLEMLKEWKKEFENTLEEITATLKEVGHTEDTVYKFEIPQLYDIGGGMYDVGTGDDFIARYKGDQIFDYMDKEITKFIKENWDPNAGREHLFYEGKKTNIVDVKRTIESILSAGDKQLVFPKVGLQTLQDITRSIAIQNKEVHIEGEVRFVAFKKKHGITKTYGKIKISEIDNVKLREYVYNDYDQYVVPQTRHITVNPETFFPFHGYSESDSRSMLEFMTDNLGNYMWESDINGRKAFASEFIREQVNRLLNYSDGNHWVEAMSDPLQHADPFFHNSLALNLRPLAGYEDGENLMPNFFEQTMRSQLKSLTSIIGYSKINEFLKRSKQKEKLLDKDLQEFQDKRAQAWANFLRVYASQALGRPSVLPVLWSENKEFNIGPLAKALTDTYYVRKYHDFIMLDDSAEHIALSLHDGIDSMRSVQRMRMFSEMEARYEILSLLAHPKVYVGNMIGGTTNTLFRGGMKNWLRAGNYKWLQQNVDPRFTDWNAVTNFSRQYGLSRAELSQELSTGEFTGNLTLRQSIIQRQSIRENGELTTQDYAELAMANKTSAKWIEKAAFFIQHSEDLLRSRAWMTGYLLGRELMNFQKGTHMEGEHFLVSFANNFVASTQFMYTNTERPIAFSTNLGKIFGRFKLWILKSAIQPSNLWKDYHSSGFDPNSYSHKAINRYLTAMLFMIVLGEYFPFSIFEFSLPQPMENMVMISKRMFSDETPRNNLLETAANITLPPITRIPESLFSSVITGDWREFADYHAWNALPFGRAARSIVNSIEDPGSTGRQLTGLPISDKDLRRLVYNAQDFLKKDRLVLEPLVGGM